MIIINSLLLLKIQNMYPKFQVQKSHYVACYMVMTLFFRKINEEIIQQEGLLIERDEQNYQLSK